MWRYFVMIVHFMIRRLKEKIALHCGDDFWGIELLREGSYLDERIDRFAPGGPYSLLQLSDYCLVDLRRVPSMGDTTIPTITTDLNRCAKLYVVCYDPTLAHVFILNAQSVWNIL
ncbi:Crinkler (CRN) family protein [Phytophthora palmivora]|uniref:Crinkler (CRN) family protein n=1 Tax=Phytophthora palmivora TaxID=4796 RepID=A0A2P4Y1I7_9STRA|nr:Crinkler (CRN) family protein [Phytophthora palmivora]